LSFRLADLALTAHLPSVSALDVATEAGMLLSYGSDGYAAFQRVVYFIDPLIKVREDRICRSIRSLARIFHQDADFWVVPGEPGRARPSQPIDHSIGKAGGAEMAVQNEPETA
jgi:hypothetical protein